MATIRSVSGAADTDDVDRRDQILEAANECFIQLGIARTSVQDVARMASVSRGTIYRYFGDRAALVSAAMEFGSLKYYRLMTSAMATKKTLAEQIGAMAETHARVLLEHRTRNRLMSDDSELLRHLIADGDSFVRRSTRFLVPYVLDAQQRGEVGAAVQIEAASEWLSRIVYSFSTVDEGLTFDMSAPETVGRYVARFAVNGLR